jgi:predicted patatin/cPLA2 family phospholipase
MWMKAVGQCAELLCGTACYKITAMRTHSTQMAALASLLSALLIAFALPVQNAAAAGLQRPADVSPVVARSAGGVEFSSQDVARKKPQQKSQSPKAQKRAPVARSEKPVIIPRQDFTAGDQEQAVISGIPNARFWADSPNEFVRALPQVPGPWLILSTGGEDGAYGAGVLAGWSAAGTRPEFSVITGVSTGALMAPFVFAGRKYDEQLRAAYTTINATDIFEIGGKGESLLDTWPLKDLVAKQVTRELLMDVAAEHQRGRRLFVLTTNLDAGRPVAWDIGAIASKGDQQALELVRNILMAAISIPGAFPPVLVEAEAGKTRFHEMHVDGGLGAQFYVAPDALQLSTSNFMLPATELYIIVNMKLGNDFQVTERSTLGILGRTVSAAIKVVARNAIDRAYVLAKRSKVPFHLAFIDEAFSAPSRGPFDSDYMKTLFEFGYAQGKSGLAFHNEPPDFLQRPTKAAR